MNITDVVQVAALLGVAGGVGWQGKWLAGRVDKTTDRLAEIGDNQLKVIEANTKALTTLTMLVERLSHESRTGTKSGSSDVDSNRSRDYSGYRGASIRPPL